ncbi:carbohydrate kinase family protein (plasmid) [Thioclava litoralis]|uniref:Carbohydrate kinase family protein n=1 Tax=Thioclava litoralis TaxID=3076557 RepID=A0ABZ1E4M9_9RHOB|nr:carbohydrate kinase family protein [Thioclava sp. FTW29]
MTAPTRRGIACMGNWILDIVHDIGHWPEKSDLVGISRQTSGLGGGAANVSADLAALDGGYPVYPIGLVGDDSFGDEVHERVARTGLQARHLRHLRRVRAGVTAHTHVMNVPGDSRTFFYHAGVNNDLAQDSVDLAALADAGCKLFYLGYLNLLPALDKIGADGRSAAYHLLRGAQAAGMMTCVDLVSSAAPGYRAVVQATLPAIDVLFLNEVEAARATGQPVAGPADRHGLEAAARALLAQGVGHAVIVHTPALALWVAREGTTVHEVAPVPPEAILSPVGAGDAFAAAVLHALHEERPAPEALALGCKVAALSLGGATATDAIPSLAELGDTARSPCLRGQAHIG